MSEAIEKAEEDGNLSCLVALIKTSMDQEEDLLEEALSATYRLATSLPTIEFPEDNVAEVAKVICSCCELYMEEAYLIEILLSIIRCFSDKNADLHRLLGVESNLKMVIACMNKHTNGEETVQEQGCLVIESLAKDSSDTVNLLKAHGASEAVNQAAGLITNERNKKYAVQTLAALAAFD